MSLVRTKHVSVDKIYKKDEIILDKKRHGQPWFNGQDLPLNADDLIIGEENLEQKFRQN